MAKSLEAIVRISGDLDKSIQKALNGVAANLDQMEAAARKANGPIGELAGKIQDQSEVLEVAKKKYAGYVLSGEKGSAQAKDLKKKITQLSAELNDNKSKLAAAEDAAEKLAGGLDDAGGAARNAGDGFTVMKGTLANLASSGIQKVVDKAIEGAKALYGLADSTREYREDMGKLETAWESAGKSTDLATKTYKNFYSVLGEEDRSVEAVNHLAKFVNSEQDMQKWTNICTGVWGTFGDSLPIEGLTEASNETAKVGKITGVLADALNWAGVNEEKFQEQLDACSNESERAALITETMNKLYSDAAENYRENNASIMEARKAQSDYNDTLAAMGEKMEPVTTAVREGLNKILTKALEVMEKIDFEALAAKIGPLTDKVIELATNGFGWLKDNADWLVPAIGGIVAAFGSFKAIGGIVSIFGKVGGAISKVVGIFKTVSGAGAIFKGVMAAISGPVGWIALAIGAVVAAGIALYKNWDTVKEKAAQLGAWLSSVWAGIKENAAQVWTTLTSFISGAWNSIKTAAMSAWSSITSAVMNAWNAIKAKASELAAWLASVWSAITSAVSAAWSGITGAISSAWANIKARVTAAISIVRAVITGAWNAVRSVTSSIWNGITSAISGAWNTIKSKVSSMVSTVKSTITTAFDSLKSKMMAPFEAVIGIVEKLSGKVSDVIGKIGEVGGNLFSGINIPFFASGGFTNGVSIAGEAGTEAVISFDPRYRAENLGYWAKAGRMLGADFSDFSGFTLSGSSNSTYVDMGGVTFAPNITITGQADKQSIMEAIEEEYPEFIDMLEEWFAGRGLPVYG